MELLLVVAIMVVVAAVSVPAVQRVFARQALQKGSDRLRVAMGQARVRAIKNGEEYAVFFVPEGSWFNVAPFYDFPQQQSLANNRQNVVATGLYSDYESDLLPRGVQFLGGEAMQDSRYAAAASDAGAESSNTLQSILFYPDGTSQDARVILQNEKGNQVQVELRGLTGISKSVRIEQRTQ